MSDSEIISSISGKVQRILDASFKEPYRRRIEAYQDRLNFCCPVCGDSGSDIRKKRGNIYFASMSFHCFNCNAHMGINSFLHRYDEELSSQEKVKVFEIQRNAKKFERAVSARQTSMSFRLLETLAVPKGIFFRLLGLETPYHNEESSGYLKSRKIDIRDWKYFAYDGKSRELYILNITPLNKVIGYQIRQLDPASVKSRYVSRCMSKMYVRLFERDLSGIVEKILGRDPMGVKYLESEDGIGNIVSNLDRLSGIFNIMNVDMDSPMTVFEGPIDSLVIPNSVALQGAGKSFGGFFDEIPGVRYLYDNDMTGKKMSIEKLRSGKNVFLWERYLGMMGIHEKTKDMKDMNNLLVDGLVDIPKIEKCFSDDELDIMYI